MGKRGGYNHRESSEQIDWCSTLIGTLMAPTSRNSSSNDLNVNLTTILALAC